MYTCCIKSGKNGARSFIVKDGKMSANKMAPVEILLHARFPSSANGAIVDWNEGNEEFD
jgi:hypothetical protein